MYLRRDLKCTNGARSVNLSVCACICSTKRRNCRFATVIINTQRLRWRLASLISISAHDMDAFTLSENQFENFFELCRQQHEFSQNPSECDDASLNVNNKHGSLQLIWVMWPSVSYSVNRSLLATSQALSVNKPQVFVCPSTYILPSFHFNPSLRSSQSGHVMCSCCWSTNFRCRLPVDNPLSVKN